MQWVYAEYGQPTGRRADCEHYGQLDDYAEEIRAHLKRHFADLKEKQIKDLLDAAPGWHKSRVAQGRALQREIGSAQHDDFNAYDEAIKAASKRQASLDAKEKSRSPMP
jgi:type I restriction enzyme M protein